jgi:hypothetical protein
MQQAGDALPCQFLSTRGRRPDPAAIGATFGRFQPFGKTLAEIAVYIGATIDKGFVAARP